MEAIPSLLDFIGESIGDALSTFTMSRLWCLPTTVMHETRWVKNGVHREQIGLVAPWPQDVWAPLLHRVMGRQEYCYCCRAASPVIMAT